MPRPEEIIVDIYRQIQEFTDRGARPLRIVASPSVYRSIQDYRTSLGELDDASLDYLGKHELFNLPFYIDEKVPWRVDADLGKSST